MAQNSDAFYLQDLDGSCLECSLNLSEHKLSKENTQTHTHTHLDDEEQREREGENNQDAGENEEHNTAAPSRTPCRCLLLHFINVCIICGQMHQVATGCPLPLQRTTF